MNNNIIKKVQRVFDKTETEDILGGVIDVMGELDFPRALMEWSLYDIHKTTLGWFITAPEGLQIEVNTWTQKICVFIDHELIEEINNPHFD